MKTILIGVLLLFATSALATDTIPQSWPKDTERVVVRAFYDDVDALSQFKRDRAPWSIDPQKRFFIIDVDQQQYAQLVEQGYRVELDSQAHHRIEHGPRHQPHPARRHPGLFVLPHRERNHGHRRAARRRLSAARQLGRHRRFLGEGQRLRRRRPDGHQDHQQRHRRRQAQAFRHGLHPCARIRDRQRSTRASPSIFYSPTARIRTPPGWSTTTRFTCC